jgi:hemerythrin
MIFKWDSNLATGVSNIDNQHKELFERTNVLLNAMSQGKGKEEVSKTLDFLEQYVIKHFNEEEELQLKNNYSGYNMQKEQHENFKRQLTDLRKRFEKDGISSSLAIETQKNMSTWWRNHITKLDKNLGEFLLERTN